MGLVTRFRRNNDTKQTDHNGPVAADVLAGARAELEATLNAVGEAQRVVKRIREPLERMRALEADEAAAQQALDEIKRADAEDFRNWSGIGPEPAPRYEERRAAEQRLSEARQRAEAARAQIAHLTEQLQTCQGAAAQRAAEVPQRIRAVLLEDAERIGTQYTAAVQTADRLCRELQAIDEVARRLTDDRWPGFRLGGTVAGNLLVPGFKLDSLQPIFEGQSHQPDATKPWVDLARRLGSDPRAEVDKR